MSLWQRWLRQPQTILFRRVLFQVHLYAGIGVGLYVFVICLSGSILVYRNELYAAFSPRPRVVEGRGDTLSVEQANAAAARAYPEYEIRDVRPGKAANHAFEVTLVRDGETMRRHLHPFSGQDLGNAVPLGFRASSWLLDLHDNLLAGETGRRVNGAGALLVVLLCLTGAVIWWPGRPGWRRSLTFDLRANWRRLVWTLHSALGFWFFTFILMWGITGAYLGFQERFAAMFDSLQPFDPDATEPRIVDRIQYWLTYSHFGRLGGRGIPGCGRGLCNSITKATWAAAGLVPPAMFVTGAVMWWNRVLRPAGRRTNGIRSAARAS